MRYVKIEHNSVANGPGVRVVLWCQGCRVHCPGCHNPSTWSFSDGTEFDAAAMQELDTELNKNYVDGITFSGGHPLEPENAQECLNIAQYIKDNYPNKTIWLYTGLTLNYANFIKHQVAASSEFDKTVSQLLRLCDIIVDGPYIEAQRDITLQFRGSRNQRLIDVKKTLEQEQLVQLDLV